MAPKLFRRSPNRAKSGTNENHANGTSKIDEKFATKRVQKKWHGLHQFMTSSNILLLLGFVPFSILGGHFEWNPTFVFSMSMLAILPLAMLLSNATEELSKEAGEVVGALLNATFGNAVEMIVSTVALTRGEIKIVQSSMLGAILSNILLCLGTCLFIGGWSQDCTFNATAAATMASLMVVASSSLIIPAALNLAFPSTPLHSILLLSRFASIIMLVLYLLYLHFQLRTHSHLFEEERQESTPVEEEEETVLTPTVAVCVLAAVSVLIALCAENLVNTLDPVVSTLGINKTFIGLIILPVVGNAAEYVSAFRAASRGHMSLSLSIAVGSSMQIALFVTPSLVLLGWLVGQPMSLSFDPFGAVVFYLSVIVVEGLISDGGSNYLEGAMLVGIWGIVGGAFAVYPTE